MGQRNGAFSHERAMKSSIIFSCVYVHFGVRLRRRSHNWISGIASVMELSLPTMLFRSLRRNQKSQCVGAYVKTQKFQLGRGINADSNISKESDYRAHSRMKEIRSKAIIRSPRRITLLTSRWRVSRRNFTGATNELMYRAS